MAVIFETPRLFLRHFLIEDAGLLLRLNSDPEVLKFLHEPPIESIEAAEDILRRIILPQYELHLGRWAIQLKADHQFIGWCGLKSRPELNEIDLGYRFKKDYWGNGYATEAAQHTLKYGFDSLKLGVVTGRVHIDNIASIRVLEKIGMRFIGEGIVDDCPVKTYIASK
ncbi:MAG: GNAT family N-acetyltransferase [Ferruginibacter sp.]